MYEILKALDKISKEVFDETKRGLLNVQQQITEEDNLKELVDSSFALREISDRFDELKRSCNKLKSFADTKAVIKGSETETTKVQTEYCTATLDADTHYPVPKKADKNGYDNLMSELGIPKELVDFEVVRLHWPGWTEYTNELLESGRPLPTNIDLGKGVGVPKVICRRRK